MFTVSQRVALVQAGMVPLAVLIGGGLADWTWGFSAGYGVLVALVVSGVLIWRERQSRQHPEWDQKRLLAQFIRTGIERVVLLVFLLALGFGVLHLTPLPLLLGLVAAQLAWLVVALNRNTK